mmetsp:Transcript_59288/g.170256  ORF Transcript_59288/g.170256 Transcript_59288/m.170256 type:complete len:197 (+) Transcript_59288:227-817(+)
MELLGDRAAVATTADCLACDACSTDSLTALLGMQAPLLLGVLMFFKGALRGVVTGFGVTAGAALLLRGVCWRVGVSARLAALALLLTGVDARFGAARDADWATGAVPTRGLGLSRRVLGAVTSDGFLPSCSFGAASTFFATVPGLGARGRGMALLAASAGAEAVEALRGAATTGDWGRGEAFCCAVDCCEGRRKCC